jgi:hypothetical protein
MYRQQPNMALFIKGYEICTILLFDHVSRVKRSIYFEMKLTGSRFPVERLGRSR